METTEATKIAKLNDAFRKSGQGITVTTGVQALEDLIGLVDEIRRFKDFNENNDPYQEHDFGTVYWFGQKVFWKIDYYNTELSGWRDPLDPSCNRILTIMLAEEY